MQTPKIFWDQVPFFKLFCALALGIGLGSICTISPVIILTTIAILSVVFLIFHFKIEQPKQLTFISVIGFLLMGLLGLYQKETSELQNNPAHFSQFKNTEQAVGTIEQPLEKKENSFKTILRITDVVKDDKIQSCNGKLLVYFSKEIDSAALTTGKQIVFTPGWQEIKGPENPGAFDYKKYMARNSIYQSIYLDTFHIKILESNPSFNFKANVIYFLKSKYLDILDKYIPTQNAKNLAEGIIIGQKSDLDPELFNQFQHAGIIHILSVSGLHVGIIFLIFSFLLDKIPVRNKKWVIVKTLILLSIIWLFALITGFSPAVQRSALMFSLLSFGKTINRKTNTYNVIFASAFLLAFFHPTILGDVGFQLSYAAVLGIIFLYKKLYALWVTELKIWDRIWKMICVSTAAQLATMPLALYYFGNFPVYFLPANIVAIPLSSGILFSGVALIPLSFIPFLGKICGSFIWLCCLLMEKLVSFLEHLPYGNIENLSFPLVSAALLYSVGFCLILYLVWKKQNAFYGATLFSFGFIFSLGYYNYSNFCQPKIVFYQIPKASAVGISYGKTQLLFADSSMIYNPQKLQYSTKGSWRKWGLDNIKPNPIQQSAYIVNGSLLALGDKKCLIWKPDWNNMDTCKLKMDYILLKNNVFVNIKTLKNNFEFTLIIIDGSNSKKYINKVIQLLKAENLKYYVTSENGAFVANI